ncbi:MAG: FtsW/RodA/SpoVE family cell cycle protein [Candidatus Kapaibacteriota bacterium]
MEREIFKIDWILFSSVSLLLIFSVLAIYSSSTFYAEYKFGEYDIFFWNHLRNVVLSFTLMIVLSFVDYNKWIKISTILLFVSLFLLILVLFIGTTIKGAARWINLGFLNFQPSELAKFSLILYISKILSEREQLKDEPIFILLPALFWITTFCFFIVIQPNFSTSMFIFIISIALLFIGKIKFKYLLRTSLIFMFVGSIFAATESYRLKRILGFFAFLNNYEAKSNLTYQTSQALIAIGNGGIFGLGIGKTQQSKLFLPESYGDYIFSIIAEEYGFIGAVFVILLLLLVLVRMYRIAKKSPTSFAFFFSAGTFLSIATFTIVNSFVNIGFLPSTGLPMPFISYGGSALVINCISIGILQNIYRNITTQKYE